MKRPSRHHLEPLQIMSYNILYPHDTKWGRNYRWPPRAPELLAQIRRHAADLVGLQEVSRIQLEPNLG